MRLDPALKKYASPKQLRVLEALEQAGTARGAARLLGMHHSTVQDHLASVKAKAALQGYAPEHDWDRTVPQPHIVSGVSTYYDKDGVKAGQWVKSKLGDQMIEEGVRAFAEALVEPLEGQSRLIDFPQHCMTELHVTYLMGDPHYGMYAWKPEAGEDFDVAIAGRDLKAASSYLVSMSPPAKHALILCVGDLLHADNLAGVTSRSGNRLDVDTRLPHVMQLVAQHFVWMVEHALLKHEIVEVVLIPGNHDDLGSIMVAMILAAYFRNNDRVKVRTDPGAFYYKRFGKVLIASTHGHNVKPRDVMEIVAADVPELFGQTLYRYAYLGHWHHQQLWEFRTGIVEYLRTLASRDAWAQSNGYRSGRDMRSVVHHEEYGEVQRFIADIRLVRKQLEG